jgi:histone-lysine N-methyltransferase SETMAR
LRTLQDQQDRGWHDVVTLDESRFYYTTNHESIWLPADEKVPERERKTVKSKKLMVTIVWNPNGFHFIDVFPNGSKFNAKYYTNKILSRVSEWRQETRGGATRRLIVHADNARPHTAAISTSFLEENGMMKAHHPPYSPDLGPSDFYLFGYIIRNLSGTSFDEGRELLSAIVDNLDFIEKATLNRVFLEWMERLRRCLDISGDYVE